MHADLKLPKIAESERLHTPPAADHVLAEIFAVCPMPHGRLPHVMALCILYFSIVTFHNSSRLVASLLSYLFAPRLIAKIIPSVRAIPRAIAAVRDIEVYRLYQELMGASSISVSLDAGTGKGLGSFTPTTCSFLKKGEEGGPDYIVTRVVDTAEVPKGGASNATCLEMLLSAFGVCHKLFAICTDGAADMVLLHFLLRVQFPTLVCTTCALHSLNLVLAGAWSSAFNSGKVGRHSARVHALTSIHALTSMHVLTSILCRP
jgi:hypothetical protein